MTSIGDVPARRHVRLRGRFSGRIGIVVPLLVLLPVLVGYGTVETLLNVNSGATLQKILVLMGIAISVALIGFRVPPWPVFAIFGVFGVALVLGLTLDRSGFGGEGSTVLRGTAGYVYAWCAFFVDWRRVTEEARALALACAPLLALLISLPLTLGGHASFIMHEYTGALRLAAGMPPAYVAALALFGVIGASWLWVLGNSWGLWLAVVNLAICAMTGTRGATLAAGVVFLGVLIVAIVKRLRQWRLGIGVGALGLVAGVIVFLPLFLKRFTSSEHDAGALSGRSEAWAYFLSRYQEHPWIGYGPGGATILAQESGNSTIMRSFVSPHSAYISLLVDIGAPLLVAFLLSLVTLLWKRYWCTTINYRPVLLIIIGAVLLYGAFDNLLNAAQSAVPFALFLAMVGAGRLTNEDTSDEGSLPFKYASRRARREQTEEAT